MRGSLRSLSAIRVSGRPTATEQLVDLLGQLLEQVGGPLVDQRVHGVEPQPVDVDVAQPHQRVVDDVAAHLVGVGPRQVDRVAPGVRAAFGEDREELGQVVPRRAEVVVDDVLDHAEPLLVAGVDEALVGRRAAVLLLHGVPEHAVVAPVVRAVERVDRQQLDEVDAEPTRWSSRPIAASRVPSGVNVPTCSS